MINSLLAILLVINSSRGSHFVFHYPKVPQRRNEIEQFRRESDLDEEFGDDLLENDVITWPYGSTEDFDKRSLRSRFEDIEEYDFNPKSRPDDTGNDEIERNEMNKLFGFETRLLADIFCPRHKGLTKFQLSIDDLTFVGQPVFLKTKVDVKKREIYNRDKDLKKKIDDDDNGTDLDGDDELQEQLFRSSDVPSKEMSTQIPSSVVSDHSDASSTHSMKQHLHLTFFHLVFVLEPPELELCKQVDDIYKNIVTKLTAALRYEQLRCDYVGKEAELILSLRENSGISTLDELMDITLERSSLAQTIRKLYDAISTDSVAHILINDYIDLSLQIPPLVPNPSNNDIIGHEYAHYPIIAPYHTLLLLEDPEEILKNTPLDANPTLVQLVQILTPAHRLADLCSVLDCSMAQIFRLAAHLIYWRKAKIIDVISNQNLYVVSPTADMNSLPTHIEYFKQHFPPLDLVAILAKDPKSSASSEDRMMYREAITYLLRKDLVVQLHAYILVMIPQYIKMGYTRAEYEKKLDSGNSEGRSVDDAVIISPFDKASESEREWLNNLVANHPKETVSLFERLIKYFNGKHHINEILFRETLKKKDLGKVLNLFSKDQLIIIWC